MEHLPKPLIALINSIVEEYEQFTWNSICLGDKMRVSLIWTRGDFTQVNKGVKHKSKSCRERDEKRLKVWQDNNVTNNVIENDTVDFEQRTNTEALDISSDNDLYSDDEMLSLEEAPEQVNFTPVVDKPVIQAINTDHNTDNLNRAVKGINKGAECRTINTNKTNDKHVTDVISKQKDEVTIIAPRSIVTGKSPCTDSHYEKVTFCRTPQGDLIIGKIKMRNTIVTRNLSLNDSLTHIDKEKRNYVYTELAASASKYKDIRKMTTGEYRQNVSEIPNMERYAEDFRLCPYCFDN